MPHTCLHNVLYLHRYNSKHLCRQRRLQHPADFTFNSDVRILALISILALKIGKINKQLLELDLLDQINISAIIYAIALGFFCQVRQQRLPCFSCSSYHHCKHRVGLGEAPAKKHNGTKSPQKQRIELWSTCRTGINHYRAIHNHTFFWLDSPRHEKEPNVNRSHLLSFIPNNQGPK